MAKTIKSTHPWVELIDLQIKQAKPLPVASKKAGRPPARIKRTQSSIKLTEGERETLDELTTFLSDQFKKTINRGNLIGYLVFRFSEELKVDGKFSLPDDISSFAALTDYIEKLK